MTTSVSCMSVSCMSVSCMSVSCMSVFDMFISFACMLKIVGFAYPAHDEKKNYLKIISIFISGVYCDVTLLHSLSQDS